MVFQLRVRGRSSMQRLLFRDATSTLRDIRLQIQDLFKVPASDQVLSLQPLSKPALLVGDDSDSISKLGLKDGDILYLAGEEENKSNTSAAPKPPANVSRITPRCRHGPNGACPNCLRMPEDPSKPTISGHCNHGPNATCLHCSQYVKLQSDAPAAWLCNHPNTVFCPKCLPPEDPSLPHQLPCDCDRAKGQSCIKCVQQAPLIKVDKIPYSRYIEEKKGLCKFKHGPSMSCAFCLPDPFPSFAAKKGCDRGHAPWPQGVCLNCAPPNAILRVQPYRHTDSVSMESRVIQNFYTNSMRRPQVQKAAILFGTHQPEPEETKNPGAVRALVYAVYEPPQEFDEKSGIRFPKDEREKSAHEIAARLGLEPVGWVITTQKREGEKYGGPVFMSGPEIQQAARFQLRYKNEDGFSRFVTVVIEHAKEVEPRAFQVADMAAALEKENAFAPTQDPYMLSTRKPGKNELVPTIVYKDRPMQPGEEFLPDELLVKVNIFAPKQSDPMFAHAEVPSNAGETYLHSYFAQYKGQKWEEKLSDFNLLVALHRHINPAIVTDVCDCIREKKPLKTEVKTALERELQAKKLI